MQDTKNKTQDLIKQCIKKKRKKNTIEDLLNTRVVKMSKINDRGQKVL